MEETISLVIQQLPNFAAVFIMLFWQKQTIDRLLDTQATLVDRLLKLTEEHHTQPTAQSDETR